jgi:cytochrome c-type biogenesis protein CcmH/NrfG
MSIEPPNDIDRAAIEEHARRTTERTALRKVRKTLDRIEEEQAAERRTLRRVLVVCAILALLGVCYFAWLVLSAGGLHKQAPLRLPATPQQTR